MNRLSFALLSVLALSSGAVTADESALTQCYRGYPGVAIQNFHNYESQMLHWDSRYNGAPSGSPEERVADQQRRNFGQAALNTVFAQGALANYSQQELENFAIQMVERFNQARSGSYVETVYRQTLDLAWNSFAQNAEADLHCGAPTDFRPSIHAAQLNEQKYQQARTGSRAEAAYLRLVQAAWNAALTQVQSYTSNAYSQHFKTFENLAFEFVNAERVARSGSRAENFYRQGLRLAFTAAHTNFRSQVYTFNDFQLNQYLNEYLQLERNAPTGSSTESYGRNMITEINAELNRRNPGYPQPPAPVPPRPIPVPPPVPRPPQPIPVPPPRPNPPGMITCWVTTQRATYQGRGTDPNRATAAARSECLKFETSFVCNAAPVSCR